MRQILVALAMPWAPGDAFRSRSAWMMPFAVIALARLLLEAALHRAVTAATVLRLPPGADGADRAAAALQLDNELPARLMLLPVRTFVACAAVAALLALLVRLWRPPRPLLLSQFLALAVAAEGVLVAGELVRAGSVLAGLQQGFLMPLGLDLIVAPWVEPAALPLFNVVNLFGLWYVASLALCVQALAGLPRLTASAVAVQVWGVIVVFELIVMAAVRAALHLPV